MKREKSLGYSTDIDSCPSNVDDFLGGLTRAVVRRIVR